MNLHCKLTIFHSTCATSFSYRIPSPNTLAKYPHTPIPSIRISTTHTTNFPLHNNDQHAIHPPHHHPALQVPGQTNHHPPLPRHNRKLPLAFHPRKPPAHPTQRIHSTLPPRTQHVYRRRTHAQIPRRERCQGRRDDALDCGGRSEDWRVA